MKEEEEEEEKCLPPGALQLKHSDVRQIILHKKITSDFLLTDSFN